jgi:peptidoglycan/LPS O-acetylase OafA/YrhL
MPSKVVTMPTHPERDNNFDILRLFAALLVMYGHAYPITGAATPGFAANGVQTIGVKIFFSISGFLVAQSWMRDPDLIRYLWRRSLRILPGLVVVVVLTAFLLGPLVSTEPLSIYLSSASTHNYLKNIALYIHYGLPGVFQGNPYPHAVNGSLWSLPAEVVMYFIAPLGLALAGVSGRPRAIIITLSMLLAGASLYLLHIDPRKGQLVLYLTDVWAWLAVAPYFLIGMTYAVCKAESLLDVNVAFLALFGLAVVETSAVVKEALLMLVLPYACLGFALSSGWAFRPITRHGDLSYGTFLYGFPMQQLVMHYGGAMDPWRNFFIATGLTLGCAYASWRFVEKPALAYKPYSGTTLLVEPPLAPKQPSA